MLDSIPKEVVGKVPAQFVPTAMLAIASDASLFAGGLQQGPGSDLAKRTGAIFRWKDGVVKQVYDGPGWGFPALSRTGSTCWAVAATLKADRNGSLYRTLRSRDGGETWEERGPVPVSSLQQLIAISPDELWVLGANVLSRSIDAGSTWTAVPAPGDRNPVEETLGVVEGAAALLDRHILIANRDGTAWETRPIAAQRIHLVVDHVLFATVDGMVRFGWNQGGKVEWLAAFSEPMIPYGFSDSERGLRFVGRPTGALAGAGISLFESADHGKRWKRWTLPTQSLPETAGLAPDGTWFGIDQDLNVVKGTQ